MAEERIRVLLVDDERSLRDPLAEYLQERGFAVDTAACGEEALQRVREATEPYEVLLIDDLLEPRPDEEPEYMGIELMQEIHQKFPESQAILFTGWGMTERALEALRAGAYRYLPKPFNPHELGYTVRAAAEYGRIRRERDLLEALLKISRAMVEELRVENILDVIADAVPPLLGVEGCSVAYQTGKGKILSKLVRLLGDSGIRWKRHLRDRELTGELIRGDVRFYYIEDVETHPEVDENLKKAGVRSFIGVPIPGQPERPGVLYAYSTRPGALGPATGRTLDLLAEQVGVALRVARLLEETQAEKQKLQTLYEMAREFGSCRLDSDAGLGDILKRITDLAVKSVQAEEGTLFVVNVKGEVRAWRNTGLKPDLSEEEVKKIIAEGFAGWVIRERRADILPDLERDERWIVLPGRSVEGSALGVPLLCGEEAVGTLTLTHSRRGFFTEDHQELLETMAAQAAIVIKNAEAYEERRQQANLLAALAQTSQALSGTMDLGKQLRLVEKFVREELHASMFLVALYDEERDMLRFETAYEDGKPLSMKERPLTRREDWGLSGYVVKTGEPFICLTREERETKLAALGVRAVQIGKECVTCLILPLKVGEKVIGVISIQSEQPRAWNEVEQDVFRALAGQVAVAVRNAQLFGEAQANLETIRRQVQELEQMRQAAEAMSHIFEPRQALQQIVKSAAQVLEANSAAIWSYDEVRGTFIPEELAAVGIPDEELEKFRKEEPKPGRTADTVMHRGYIAVSDVTEPEYGFLGQPTRDLLNRIGVRSFQGIALRVGDERLGVLYANYHQARSFSEEDGRKLRTFASHAALALKNARLLAQMQRTREAAGVIAGVTLQEKLDRTLKTIARHAQQVLRSDVVTIYSYDEATGRFGEWATEIRDPRRPDSARPPEKLLPDSVVWSILNLAGPTYYCLAEDRAGEHALLGGRFVQAEKIQAALGIQLRMGERKVGVMFVDFRSPHRFTSDEIATIQLFADQAAVAIRNARQYDEIVRDARLRQGLLQAGREIMALQEPKAVLRNVVDIMREVLACDVVTLYPYDQDRGEIGFPAYVAGELRNQKSLDELGYVSKDSVVGKLLASGEPRFAPDAPNDPIMSAGGFVAREGVRSSAGIPLKFGDRVIGIVFVNYRTFHPFPAQEQEALRLFATQAALAIHNAQQFEQITRKSISLEALYEAGKALSGTLTLDDILKHIVEQAWRLTSRYGKQARFSHLALREGKWLRFQAAYPPECLPGLQGGVGDIDLEGDGRIGVTGRAVKTGEARLVKDVRQDPDYIAYDSETHSELAVPIKLGEEVIGVINVEHPDYGAFDEDDRRDLELLAAQASLAIRNARQYEELRRAQGLIGTRTALAWMGMTSSVWRHAIDKHALTIREQIQLLRKDLGQASWHEHHTKVKVDERLSTIERLANQILEKPIVPPLSGEEGVEPVGLNDLVGERARQLWEKDPYKKAQLRLDLQLPGPATVRVSPEWLRRAFDILVDNAVEAVAEREVREITIGTRAASGGAEIWVSDTGPGIPEEIRAKIGLEPIEKPEEAKGLGMGLLMAQTIVQTYGGEVRVASTGPTGTTMVIWLPLVAQERPEEITHAG
ncbi:MAG: GAF domain-containing protein [Chloroflexia bacterium]